MMKTIIVTVSFFLSVLPSLADDCAKIIPEKFEDYNTVELHGYFFHPGHCFSVVIPDDVVGRDHSEPQSHQGFGAILSRPPHAAYLYVGTNPAGVVEDDNGNPGTPEDEARQAIRWLVQNGATIIRKDIKITKLGSLPATRATIIYSCPNSSVELVQDSIFAAEPNGPLHKLTLTASKPAHESARKILDQIATTWKLERKKCEEGLKKRLKGGF